jgi:hypothetical protein
MLVKYKCVLCENSIQKLFSSETGQLPFLDCACGGMMEKQFPDFGVSSIEVIDNGSMPRKVELRKDAVERAREKGDNYIKTMNERDSVIKKDKV